MINSITVLDTETASFDGGVCEIAGVRLERMMEVPERWAIDDWHHSLVSPGRPISIEAMAVHHITDEMVADAPLIETVIEEQSHIYDTSGGLTPSAHNAEFDQGVMPREWRARNLIRSVQVPADGILPTVDWIDTYRCAMHLYPESPRFSNQVLRYYLGLDVSDMPEEAGSLVHRALFDTWCTAKMLLRMLETHTPEQLIELSGQPVLLTGPIRFGKHRGTDWSALPRDYLSWMVRKSDIDDADQLHTANHYLGQGRLL